MKHLIKKSFGLPLLFALAAGAYAEDFSSDITESKTFSDGETANFTQSLSITGEGVVFSATGTVEESYPVISNAKNATLTVTDGAQLNLTNTVFNFALAGQEDTSAPSTIVVEGATSDTAASVNIKDTTINGYSNTYLGNRVCFKGTGYGSMTLDGVSYVSNKQWFTTEFNFSDNSKALLTNGASFDARNYASNRGGTSVILSNNAEFTMEKASVMYLLQKNGGEVSLADSAVMNIDGENTLLFIKGGHGGYDASKQYIRLAGDSQLNLKNSASISSSDATLYTILTDNAALNISGSATFNRNGAYSLILASGNSQINISDGGSINSAISMTLSGSASYNLVSSSGSVPSNITLTESASINAKNGATFIVQNGAAVALGESGDTENHASMNVFGSDALENVSVLDLKRGSITVDDGASVNVYGGANIVFSSGDLSKIYAIGETGDNFGKFTMTGGEISSTTNPGSDASARTFEVAGNGALVFDGVTVNDLWRYKMYLNESGTITLKNGTDWQTSGRSFDIQIHDEATLNIESGAILRLNKYGASGCAFTFLADGNGVVNVSGSGSGITTRNGSPTLTLEGNAVMNVSDGAFLGNSTDGSTRQWYFAATDDSELNLTTNAIMRLSSWNGDTSNLVNFSGTSRLNVESGARLHAGAYVNITGTINFDDSASLNVKNGGIVSSDTGSDSRHTVWNFNDESRVSLEGVGNSVNLRTLNIAEGASIAFITDTVGLSVLNTTEIVFGGTLELDFTKYLGEPYESANFTLISSAREWDMSKFICTSESGNENVVMTLAQEGDTWEIQQSGNNLVLIYTSVPEASTCAAVFGLAALAFAFARRRRN